ncbi:MAG: hypothetical protein M0Z66_12115 [Thermaerobacter sp.]|nr:hypothetical protein [Thermaerobacter sp.]
MFSMLHSGAALPLGVSLGFALLLGVVHGITPDEHTWPITFSYAVGTYSARGGLIVGSIFALAFTLQRAFLSELAYLGLSRVLSSPSVNNPVYVAVGIAMAIAGYVALRRAREHRAAGGPPRPFVSPGMAAVHGLVAGFGVGAYALILYTVLAPSMPGPAYGFLPGLLFGLGTLIIQAPAGALFGYYMRRLHLPDRSIQSIAARAAGDTLFFGGFAFAVVGLAGIFWPAAVTWSLPTYIAIPNLDSINIGLVLVMFVVLGIGFSSVFFGIRRERALLLRS